MTDTMATAASAGNCAVASQRLGAMQPEWQQMRLFLHIAVFCWRQPTPLKVQNPVDGALSWRSRVSFPVQPAHMICGPHMPGKGIPIMLVLQHWRWASR